MSNVSVSKFDFSNAENLLQRAVATSVSPAAVAEVGNCTGTLWRYSVGHLQMESNSPETRLDTIFDLASLTKVIATTTLTMTQIDAGKIDLDDRICAYIPEWNRSDRSHVTIRDLLTHSSGLTPHLSLFRDCNDRVDFEHAICQSPLEYEPKTCSVYSDLGFMLLGFILVALDPNRTPLDLQFASIAAERNWGEVCYRPNSLWRERIAPTEHDSWRGRLLIGEVHDENCYALGGVAGHAGLFGTTSAVGRFATDILNAAHGIETLASARTFEQFKQRSSVSNSSRALGWDTMLPTSSCGSRMSSEAIGHTGFTGTSLWIDPSNNRYIVLLTNRVHPSRSNNEILSFRPAFHDSIMSE